MKKEDVAADNLKILIESTTITSQFLLIFCILVVCAFSEGFCQAANLLIGPYIDSPFDKHVTDSALKSSFFVGLVASIAILEVIDSLRPRVKIALMVFALFIGGAALRVP